MVHEKIVNKYHDCEGNIMTALNNVPVERPFDDVVRGPAAVVLLRLALDPGGEELDGGVAAHAVLAGQALGSNSIDMLGKSLTQP